MARATRRGRCQPRLSGHRPARTLTPPAAESSRAVARRKSPTLH